jgi:predicted metal-dependent hydrolase
MGMLGAVTYSTHKLDYRLRYSARRTMAITVYPDGAIEVVAPKGVNPKVVDARVRKRARWILRQRLYFEQFRPRSKPRRYVGGETHLYLGRQYRLKFVKGVRNEVKLKGGFLVVASPSHTNSRHLKQLIRAWYQEKGRARILARFDAIAPRFARMGYKMLPPIFRTMTRRWGSYSKAGRILLNPDLIRAPSACIDYVVTHELTHAAHSNHSAKYYDLLDTIMPDWRIRKARLEQLLS